MRACARPSRRTAALAAALVLACAGAAAAPAAPARVVSINLCTDQLAMLLAAPGQLVSVSWLAADPASSSMASEAAVYRPNRGRAEDVFLLRPDLVLAGVWSDPAALAMLERLGVPVVTFPLVTDLDGVRAGLLRMGRALGREAAAEAAAARLAAGLAALGPPRPRGTAIDFAPGGWVSGPGTLTGAILAAAGWTAGGGAGGHVPLETMVLDAPDLLLAPPAYAGQSQAEALLDHPALRRLAPLRRTGPDWVCGTPHVLRAIGEMRR